MKKVLSLVLVLTLVLGSFSMAFAADTTKVTGAQLSDIEGNANEDAIIANCDLGIITGYTDGTYKPANAVTRAEFAAMITRMLGVPDSALAGYATTSFTDMSGYSWANSYIGFCEAKGIVTGYGNGTFGPGNTITVNEAITMVARAIGYTSNSSELVGSWPSNYVTLGKRLGLYDDVAATNVIDRASAAQVIYNALTCTVVAVDADGKTTDAYVDKDTKEGKTVLEVYLDCTPTGKILYTDNLADNSVVNTKEYVGAYVKAFLNDDEDVIAIAEVKSTFLTGDYDYENDEFEADGVTYTLKDSVLTAMGTKEYNTIVNGDVVTSEALELINGAATEGAIDFGADVDDITLAVDLSGKTIKEVYSVNKWVASEAFLYEADMLDTDDATLNGYNFATDDDDAIDEDSFILKGVASLDKIAEDNLVTVYLTDVDNSKSDIAKVTVGTKTVNGKITVVDDGDYTIAGKTYTAADTTAFATDSDNLNDDSLGDTGTAYLNYDGKIAYWDVEDAESDNYAIVTGELVPSGRDYIIKLLDKNGDEKDYVLDLDKNGDEKDDVLDLDNDGWTKSTSVETPGGLKVGNLVTYALNKSGDIKELTALDWNDAAQGKELNKNRTIIDNTKIDSGVVVFTYDGNDFTTSVATGTELTAGDFAVSKLADIETEDDLTVLYYAGGSSIDVLLVSDDNTGSDSVYAVIDSVKKAYNDDDDDVYLVSGYVNGKEYTAYTDDRDDTVFSSYGSEGFAVLELTVDTDGVITKAKGAKSYAERYGGEVVDKDGSYLVQVKWLKTSPSTYENVWCTIDPNAVVYKYDYKEDELSVAKLSDIKKATGNKEGTYVSLAQLDDDSEVYDIVIIYENVD